MKQYLIDDPFAYDTPEVSWRPDWETPPKPPKPIENIEPLAKKTNRIVQKNKYNSHDYFKDYLKQNKKRIEIEQKMLEKKRAKFYFGDESDDENNEEKYVTYKSSTPPKYLQQPAINSKEFVSPYFKPIFRLPEKKIITEPPKKIVFKLPPFDDNPSLGGKKTRRKKTKNKKRKTLKKK